MEEVTETGPIPSAEVMGTSESEADIGSASA